MNISDSLNSASRSLVLLAPANYSVTAAFRRVSHNYSLYDSFRKEMQRLRGRLYCNDGAISQRELTPDGRHELSTDENSWHLLTVDRQGVVAGCARYLQHSGSTTFSALSVRHAQLANCARWGQPLRFSVESEMRRARTENFSYVELGGWAMDPGIRCTAECLRSVLTSYAWCRLIGGALGISTVTDRNGSAAILRRLGGKPLEWDGTALPSYFDPNYNCRMHVLRFDSRRPNPRYESSVEQIRQMLAGILVVSPESSGTRAFQPGSIRTQLSVHTPSHTMVHAA